MTCRLVQQANLGYTHWEQCFHSQQVLISMTLLALYFDWLLLNYDDAGIEDKVSYHCCVELLWRSKASFRAQDSSSATYVSLRRNLTRSSLEQGASQPSLCMWLIHQN